MLPVLLTALLGCRNIEEAPPDLDGALQGLWTGYESGSDEELRELAAALDGILGGAALTEPVDGTLADLSGDGPAIVGLETDPSLAAGMYLAGPIGCGMDDLRAILVAEDQDALYLDIYDSYARTYEGDPAAWLADDVPEVGWTVDIAATILGASYTERIAGGVRYVPEGNGVGPLVLARTWLLEPAVFESDGKSFDQDFQIEIYWPRDADILHVYGLWRQMDFGSGLTTDDEGVVRIQLNNLHDWDARTSEICASGSVPR